MQEHTVMDTPAVPDVAGVGALQGIKVVDLSRVLSGPFCTQLLADHGAHVIKIEPPGGDETRQWGPPFVDGVAAYFRGVNRNKHGGTLDLSRADGRGQLLQLLEDADVLVENFKAGTMQRWGIGYDLLSQRFPRLVYCGITGFGEDGPLGAQPGYDAAVQAICGIMSINGEPEGAPTRVGIPVVDVATGMNAVIGILLALNERGRSGRGQRVEVSLFDSALGLLHPHASNYFASGAVPKRTGNAHPNITPYDQIETASVPIFLAVGNDRQFASLCEVLDVPHLSTDERYCSNASRSEHRASLMATLRETVLQHDGHTLADRLMGAGVPCAPVLNVDEALRHPHTAHRQRIVEIAGERSVASPITLGRTPATYRLGPPLLQPFVQAR
jgi:crotonobetainyl-CoA:carnitine CoA-transferase CaiB-like acyl-CoA transferase